MIQTCLRQNKVQIKYVVELLEKIIMIINITMLEIKTLNNPK